MKVFPTITTERLVLRKFSLTDAPDVQRMAGDVDVARNTLNMPHPYTDGIAEEWINSVGIEYDLSDLIVFAITIKDTGNLIGAIGLTLKPQFRNAEIGYWIGKEYWNKGYATEASIGVINYAFTNLAIHKIHANHFVGNDASERVMQKAGMHFEGFQMQHIWHWNAYKDLKNYAIFNPNI